jgi:uncharacterized iron-regulated protein
MRQLLALGLLVLLAACVARPAATVSPPASIFEVATRAPLTPAAYQQRVLAADAVLLGESHDNPAHHAHRAALIAAIGTAKPSIVMEMMDRGAQLAGPPTDEALKAAGFNAQGWKWPLHQPLFEAAHAIRQPIVGGNLDLATVRQVVRIGAAALPARYAALIDTAPLAPAGTLALNADLEASHCNMLPASRLGGMALAQRARDAAMAQTLVDQPTGPRLLITGNGHVRRDYGVPTLLGVARPDWRVLAVGYLEWPAEGDRDAAVAKALAEARGIYDVVVFTAGVDRPDMCEQMRRAMHERKGS